MANNQQKIPSDKEKRTIFEINSKYFTICIYSLFVILIGTVLIYCIVNWEKTRQTISNIIHVLSPFIIGFFIAYILNPLVKRLDQTYKKHLFHNKLRESHRHALSILSSYIIAIGLIVIISFYIVPQFRKSFVDLSERLPDMYNSAYNYLNDIQKRYPDLNIAYVEDKINHIKPKLIEFGTNMVTNGIPLIFNISLSILKTLINIILSIVISSYILIDKKILIKNAKRFIYSIFSKDRADYFCSTLFKCNSIFSGFIFGKLIDSLIIGLLCFILMVILRLPYAVLLSTIVGITNMIPYFGPFIGAVPGILIYLLLDPVRSIIFGVLVLLLQQFDGLYLGPKILGESTGLKPIWVIFAITVGGAYFGVIGMFLGVPVVAVIAFLLEEFITRRLKKKNIDM